MIRLLGTLLLYWAAVACTASVVYHATGAWRSTEMGRHVLAYMAALAAVLDLAAVRQLVGPFPGYDIARLTVFAGVPLVMTWRLWLQIRARRLDRQDGDRP